MITKSLAVDVPLFPKGSFLVIGQIQLIGLMYHASRELDIEFGMCYTSSS